MIINKEYALVDAKVRTHINLYDYEKEIRQAAEIIFREDLKDVHVKQFSFTISIDSPTLSTNRFVSFLNALAAISTELASHKTEKNDYIYEIAAKSGFSYP
ncbi:hypothetical protein [Kluyvera ascorbata]|uniref:hypothetical protein n=1 Tax=Kluyvera ascorbata TaxID=51288 RepID=UPI0034D53134